MSKDSKFNKLKFFSLFSGIGGLDYGLHKEGSECVGISDIKESSVRIYKRNYGEINNYGDITKIDFSKLPDFDLLCGGFPCQSFSMAGLREGFDSEKGKMIFYIYELLKVKNPDYIVLENVKGILSHDKGKTLHAVISLLMDLGYFVRVLELNSLYYGCAQNRERVFFLCSKKDFDYKLPSIIDSSKRFRDIRTIGPFKFVKETAFNLLKIEQKRKFNFELIGGYDRVGTLTTQEGCGEKLVYENGKYRYLTILECERL